MAGGATNKQHVIPQCYLRGFANTNQQLYVYDKFKGRSYKAHVKDIAQKHRFYDFQQDNGKNTHVETDAELILSLEFEGDMPHPQSVEDILAKLEEDYATALRKIQQTIAQRKPLSQQQKYIFSHFIAVQWRRTPEHRRTLIELLENFSTKAWNMIHPDKSIRLKFDAKSASIAQAVDMFDPQINEQIIQVLMSHIWTIGSTTSDTLLYTSDQPVVKMSRGEMQGFGSPGIQITLPLTPRNALLIYDRGAFAHLAGTVYDDGYIDLDSEDVKHYNSIQLRDSYQHIYSQNSDFLFATEYCIEHPRVCEPKEHRVQIV